MLNEKFSPQVFNNLSKGHFPEFIGVVITELEEGEMIGEMPIKPEYFAPNGYLHAGSIVTFADTLAGYAAVAHLPEKAKSFTTLELKSNFIKGIKAGTLLGVCTAEHLGRSTQVWKVEVKDKSDQKTIALFSCTQLIIY